MPKSVLLAFSMTTTCMGLQKWFHELFHTWKERKGRVHYDLLTWNSRPGRKGKGHMPSYPHTESLKTISLNRTLIKMETPYFPTYTDTNLMHKVELLSGKCGFTERLTLICNDERIKTWIWSFTNSSAEGRVFAFVKLGQGIKEIISTTLSDVKQWLY